MGDSLAEARSLAHEDHGRRKAASGSHLKSIKINGVMNSGARTESLSPPPLPQKCPGSVSVRGIYGQFLLSLFVWREASVSHHMILNKSTWREEEEEERDGGSKQRDRSTRVEEGGGWRPFVHHGPRSGLSRLHCQRLVQHFLAHIFIYTGIYIY